MQAANAREVKDGGDEHLPSPPTTASKVKEAQNEQE
jgi:hypothetical protein